MSMAACRCTLGRVLAASGSPPDGQGKPLNLSCSWVEMKGLGISLANLYTHLCKPFAKPSTIWYPSGVSVVCSRMEPPPRGPSIFDRQTLSQRQSMGRFLGSTLRPSAASPMPMRVESATRSEFMRGQAAKRSEPAARLGPPGKKVRFNPPLPSTPGAGPSRASFGGELSVVVGFQQAGMESVLVAHLFCSFSLVDCQQRVHPSSSSSSFSSSSPFSIQSLCVDPVQLANGLAPCQ